MKFENKYMPTNLSEFVFPTASAKTKIDLYIKNKMDGHLLLHGKFGTGKTTLAKLLPLELARQTDPNCNEVWYQHEAGHHVNVETVKQLQNTAGLVQLQLPKALIVIDEADQMTKAAMDALKAIIDESQRFCSFIFCTNHYDKIEGGIQSRCVDISFDKSDVNAMTSRAKSILSAEGVKLPDDAIQKLITESGGDYRRLLQSLEAICFSVSQRAA